MRIVLAWWVLAGCLLAWPLGAAAESTAAPPPREATLRLLNRDVVTLRATLAGAPPEVRAERAQQRILGLPPSAYDEPLHTLPLVLGDAKGVEVMLGDRTLFALVDADVDPEARPRELDALARQTVANLEAARQAWHETRDTTRLWTGAARVLLVTAAAAAIGWLAARGARRGAVVFERRRRLIAAEHRKVVARELTLHVVTGTLRLLQWAFYAMLAYAWTHLVLGAFAATSPLADRLATWTMSRLLWLVDGIAESVPSLVSVLIVLALTRLVADVLGYGFDAVHSGRLRIAGLHAETIGATKRIVTIVVWALGIAVAYPYLPGASSQAFQGISVLVGLMVTLGSTGIVSQAMSGLVVIYARALRKGDHVVIGDMEGVVTEVSAMATKLVNLRNEEITIPNSVLVGSAIRNFSKQAGTEGTLLSTVVTVGYDVPWRQVHQLLEEAARATAGLRAEPAPRVYQRELANFYVAYELQVSTDTPAERVGLLSDLRANILDVFERAQVQLLSPDFLANLDAGRLGGPAAPA